MISYLQNLIKNGAEQAKTALVKAGVKPIQQTKKTALGLTKSLPPELAKSTTLSQPKPGMINLATGERIPQPPFPSKQEYLSAPGSKFVEDSWKNTSIQDRLAKAGNAAKSLDLGKAAVLFTHSLDPELKKLTEIGAQQKAQQEIEAEVASKYPTTQTPNWPTPSLNPLDAVKKQAPILDIKKSDFYKLPKVQQEQRIREETAKQEEAKKSKYLLDKYVMGAEMQVAASPLKKFSTSADKYNEAFDEAWKQVPEKVHSMFKPVEDTLDTYINNAVSVNPQMAGALYLSKQFLGALKESALGVHSGLTVGAEGMEDIKSGQISQGIGKVGGGVAGVVFAPAMTKFNTILNAIPYGKEISNAVIGGATSTAVGAWGATADKIGDITGNKQIAQDLKNLGTPLLENLVPMAIFHTAGKAWAKANPLIVKAKLNSALKSAERQKGGQLTDMEAREAISNVQIFKGFYGRDLFNPERMIGLKGGKEGTPGIDYPAPPPVKPAAGEVTPATRKYMDEQQAAQKPVNKKIEVKDVAQHLDTITTRIKELFIDSSAGVQSVIRKSGIKEKPADSFNAVYDKALRAANVALQFMKDSGFTNLLQNVSAKDYADFGTYLLSRRKVELHERGKERSKNIDADKAVVSELGTKYEGLAKQVSNYSFALLEQGVKSGTISRDTFNALLKKYPDYIPLDVVLKTVDNLSSGIVKMGKNGELELVENNPIGIPLEGDGKYVKPSAPGSLTKQKSLQALSENAVDLARVHPLEALISRTNQMFREITTNDVARTIVNFQKEPVFKGIIKTMLDKSMVDKGASLKELLHWNKGLKTKYERVLSSDKAVLRKLQSEINRLNKEGYDAYLKRPEPETVEPLMSETVAKRKTGTVVTDTGTFKRKFTTAEGMETKYALPKPGEIKGIIEQIVKTTPDGLAAIKKKLATREPKVAELIDRLSETEGLLDQVNTARKEQWRQLQDQAVRKIEDAGEIPIYSWVDGVREIHSVPAEMGNFMKGLNKSSSNMLLKVMDSLNRGFKAGTTGVNPGFALSNVIRDLGANFVNTKHGWRLLHPANMARAVSQSVASALGIDTKISAEINRLGGLDTTFDIFKPGAEAAGIKEIQAGKNWVTKAKDAAKHPMKTLQSIVGFSEKPARLGVYEVSKRQYLKQKDAQGKQLYTEADAEAMAYQDALMGSANFARQGSLSPQIRSLYPYLPAALRGTESFRRGMKENGVAGFGARLAAFLIMPSVASMSWNLTDDKRKKVYADIPQWVKDTNFVWVMDGAELQPDKTYSNVILIPKPAGIGAIISPLERGLAAMAQAGDAPGIESIANAIIEPYTSFDVTSGQKFLSTATPQFAKPIIEVAQNKSLFTGAPIYDENLNPEMQYKQGDTSGILRKIGKLGGQGPQSMQYLIKSYTGEVGLNALNLADQGAAAAGFIKPEDVGVRSILKTITRRFTDPLGGESSSKLYDKIGEAKREVAGLNKKAKEIADRAIIKFKAGDKAAAFEILKDVPEEQREYARTYIEKQKELSKAASSGKTTGDVAVASMTSSVAIQYLKKEMDAGNITNKQELLTFLNSLDSPTARKAALDYANAHPPAKRQ